MIANNLSTPVGVTFHVGFTENVPRANMQALYALFVAANNALWQISEGQARIDRIKFYDNVAPGTSAQRFVTTNGAGIDTTNIDVMVWTHQWNIPASGAVSALLGTGRNNRIMMIPANTRTFVLVHEIGHFLFQLSWAPGPLLVDEYQDGVQDPACAMEGENLPWRWCAGHNHVNQGSQPRACWAQILNDYPLFKHTGLDTAPGLPAAPIAEYVDAP